MNNFRAMLRNWKTTIIGVIAMISGIAITLGWVTPEQASGVEQGVGVLFDNADVILDKSDGIYLMVLGVIGLFSRDADKSSQDSGIR